MNKNIHASRWIAQVGMVSLVLGLSSRGLLAQEFRRIRPIRSPAKARSFDLPGSRIEARIPVSKSAVDKAVGALATAWNQRRLDKVLAENFQQRQRLSESSELRVPRDAQLQIEATRNLRTLEQSIVTRDDGVRERVSVVSVTVQTRLVHNDPANGFVAVPGENEVTLKIFEEVAE